MANKSISQLTAGGAVSGTDLFPDVQTAGVGPVKVTATQLATFFWYQPTLVNPALGAATATSINIGGATLGSNVLAVNGSAIMTSLALGGATIGSNNLAVTGTTLLGGATTVSTGGLTVGVAGTTGGTIALKGSTAGTLTLQVPATVTDYSITLPSAVAAGNGYILTSTTGGVTSWTNPTSLGIDLDVGTTAITNGTVGRVLFENTGNVLGEASSLTITVADNKVGVVSAPFGLSGNISSTAWTTSGIRYQNTAATLTDTSSSGTVATAYTDLFGGNTIAASNSTTFTNYYTMFVTQPTAGSNVTLTNSWAFGTTGNARIDGALTLTTPLTVANGGTGTSTAFTAGSVVFAGASGVYSQDNANFFWDDSNNRLGIGTTSPASNLQVNATTEWGIRLRAASNTTTFRAAFLTQRSLGTLSSPTAVTAGTIIGGLEAGGYTGSAFTSGFDGGAAIQMVSSATWAAGDTPSYMTFWTNPSGSAGIVERVRLDTVGNLLLGGTAARSTTPGSAHLDIFNGTAPVGTLTNGISLYSSSGDFHFMTSAGDAFKVGYRNVPPVGTKTSSYQLATTDVGKYVQVGSSGSITIPDTTFAEGDIISIFNNTSGNITITCSIATAYIAGTDTDKATMTLATRGVATVLFISSTVCVVSGNVS